MLGGMGPVDAVIVIFGAAVRPGGRPSAMLRRRVEAAAAFSVRFAAPLFLPTGGVGRHGPSEASVMRGLLVQCGIAPGRILLEESGTDTLSSARAVARLLRANGLAAPVFAASSAFHLPRCVLLLRLFGVPARAAGPPWASAGSRWTTRAWWWLREAAALPYDLILALVDRRVFRADR
jgi:vancomycin permeability regulator SanA